jgi:glutamyl-tRNA synthetase
MMLMVMADLHAHQSWFLARCLIQTPSAATPRVRFAPSPTGFLHVGSARTFIFNWLYARHNGGTMVLRLDDTDVERNTEASVQSIFEGLRWLGLDWDEEYKQSERLALHRQAGRSHLRQRPCLSRLHPAHAATTSSQSAQGAWLFNPGMRELSREESDRRAAAGEPFALRYRVPRGVKAAPCICRRRLRRAVQARRRGGRLRAAALGRHADLPPRLVRRRRRSRISHIIRGQDHLTNTFKHLLIFEALGSPPQFAHLPLLVAPDGAKLSKRKHGPVVSVTTYRDAGFLPQAFVNFLCLLGWSPKNDREFLTLDELVTLSRSKASTAPTPSSTSLKKIPFDPKAVWLNAEHIRALPVDELSRASSRFSSRPGFHPTPEKLAPSRRSSASASSCCAMPSPPPTSSFSTSSRPTIPPS